MQLNTLYICQHIIDSYKIVIRSLNPKQDQRFRNLFGPACNNNNNNNKEKLRILCKTRSLCWHRDLISVQNFCPKADKIRNNFISMILYEGLSNHDVINYVIIIIFKNTITMKTFNHNSCTLSDDRAMRENWFTVN